MSEFENMPPFLLPSAQRALKEASDRHLVAEAIDLSVLDSSEQTFVATVGCEGCVALHLQVKKGKVTEAHVYG